MEREIKLEIEELEELIAPGVFTLCLPPAAGSNGPTSLGAGTIGTTDPPHPGLTTAADVSGGVIDHSV